MADVNLVRKRRISILIGAQTKGQFHLIYGNEGTQALFTGLAMHVIYGSCDADTAEFYSKASGTATQEGSSDDKYSRSRPLLDVDEVITPQIGNCTIFARYVEAGFATQVALNARLTRFYEREDWKRRLKASEAVEALLLERGISFEFSDLPLATSEETKSDKLSEAYQAAMDRVAQRAGDTLHRIEGNVSQTYGTETRNGVRRLTLHKNKMVREIGRRTRLKNRDVQTVLETLIDVWTDNLVAGERIELENFMVFETQTIDRGEQRGMLSSGEAPRYVRRVSVRVSKRLKTTLYPDESS